MAGMEEQKTRIYLKSICIHRNATIKNKLFAPSKLARLVLLTNQVLTGILLQQHLFGH